MSNMASWLRGQKLKPDAKYQYFTSGRKECVRVTETGAEHVLTDLLSDIDGKTILKCLPTPTLFELGGLAGTALIISECDQRQGVSVAWKEKHDGLKETHRMLLPEISRSPFLNPHVSMEDGSGSGDGLLSPPGTGTGRSLTGTGTSRSGSRRRLGRTPSPLEATRGTDQHVAVDLTGTFNDDARVPTTNDSPAIKRTKHKPERYLTTLCLNGLEEAKNDHTKFGLNNHEHTQYSELFNNALDFSMAMYTKHVASGPVEQLKQAFEALLTTTRTRNCQGTRAVQYEVFKAIHDVHIKYQKGFTEEQFNVANYYFQKIKGFSHRKIPTPDFTQQGVGFFLNKDRRLDTP